ncbi:alkyl sulfatase C-terminal domain-containing protein [Streptomyces sp. NPDC090023]
MAENATPDRPKGQGRAEISGNPDTPAELFTHLTTPDPDFTIVTP